MAKSGNGMGSTLNTQSKEHCSSSSNTRLQGERQARRARQGNREVEPKCCFASEAEKELVPTRVVEPEPISGCTDATCHLWAQNRQKLPLTWDWEKKTISFGNFSQNVRPHPPLLRTPYPKKILVFILHFRTLRTFLVFSKELKTCQYFYIFFWE